MKDVGVESQQSPLTGATPFGKYYLLDRIGVGGMAEVFLAVAMGPEGFQRRLVIKRMLPHLSQDRAFVKMFIDEAKLSGLLSHPNLVQIFEFGQIEESFFIAMEHVHGETLLAIKQKLSDLDRLAPVAASAAITREVCLGLDYAHSLESTTGSPLGIVHRDISPSNLMLSFHGGVKILDFGIARITEEMRETKTQAGTVKGKVSYMSPEQLRMETVDGRSDVFSVGIVLHEMLTGRRLFKSNNDYTGARMVMEAPVVLPSSVNPDVPAIVDQIVMRALERNRDARYQTAGEMAEDLSRALIEMRAAADEPRRLLVSLFPPGPARSGNISLPLTPLPAAETKFTPTGKRRAPTPSASKMTKQLPEPGMDVDLGDLASGKPKRRRRFLALGVLGSAVIAIVVVTQSVRNTAATSPVSVAPAAAEPIAPVAAPAPEAPAAPTPPKPALVEVSLDSSPQDAKVTREDSGEVVGRTPLTISLPQGRDVISYRVEKDGFSPTTYKVIPDLAKAVRVELTPEPAPAEPKHVAAASHRPPAAHGRTTSAHESRTEAAAAPTPAADGPRDCAVSVASFPWADLWIDGKDTGQRTPVVHYPVTCGAHKLALRRRDLKIDRVEQVTVAPGHELKQHYEISDEYGE
jgi:serine/threonine-protein kinase